MSRAIPSIINKAIHLDIFDLNFSVAAEEIGNSYVIENVVDSKIGLFWRIGSFFLNLISEVFKARGIFKTRKVNEGVMLFVKTNNQRNSLAPLMTVSSNMYLAGSSNAYKKLKVEEEFPLCLAYLLSIFFLPQVILHFWRAKGYRKKTFSYNFDNYWLTYGYYISACLWLDRLGPKAVIVSNDHSMPNRVIVKAANDKKIPTIYLQHASVTDKFPALIFDYALLEGIDAMYKYESIKPTKTHVFLVGMIKIDEYYDLQNTHEEAKSIGICTNPLDPLERVRNLCKTLNNDFPSIQFYLRPHPGDKRDIWNTLANEYRMSTSNSRNESSLDFLQKVDVIISGDSNIILEAALMNVYPISYDFAQTDLDWYGFREYGLVEYYSDIGSVYRKIEELIHHKPNIRSRAKRYCHTVNTVYDGRSTELAIEIIQDIANRQEINMDKWRRMPNVNLKVFELDI